MRILFISKLFPHPRGVSGSVIIYNRIRFLAEAGHQVGLIAFLADHERDLVADIRPLLIEAEFLPLPARHGLVHRATCHWIATVPYPFREATCLHMRALVAERIERSQYSVAIAEFTAMGQYLFHNPLLPAVRRIISVHECAATAQRKAIRLRGWTPAGMFKRLVLGRLMRYEFALYSGADHILTLTPQERYGLLSYAPNLRVSVVPHTVDVAFYQSCLAASKEDCIVFTGSFSLEPNCDAVRWFARAVWPALRKQFPTLTFYVVGRGATPAIRRLGLHDSRIVVTGEVADIRPYLAKAKVFVCPVRMGSGFRAKILEAMAAGVPVVSTALGAEGVPAWSGDSLFIADTAGQMRQYIGLVLTDARLRQTMTRNARDLVLANFASARGMRVLDTVVHGVLDVGT